MKTYAFDELLQGISEGFSSLKEKIKSTDLSQLRNKKGYIDLGGKRANNTPGWMRMTSKESRQAAKNLGYEKTNYIAKNGEPIYYSARTKTYIS
ncbi:MAG: hypothetical protein MJ098_08895 [Saccharofermentans sp.]|nr:hypothetical protein [Saccharofermentans sp.]